tara:strand:+ start:2247 stop:2399 length:153 start_codon:yes stop_codon:yes gene_type:complete
MRITIDLNNQLFMRTEKIDDIIIDHSLATEFMSSQIVKPKDAAKAAFPAP